MWPRTPFRKNTGVLVQFTNVCVKVALPYEQILFYNDLFLEVMRQSDTHTPDTHSCLISMNGERDHRRALSLSLSLSLLRAFAPCLQLGLNESAAEDLDEVELEDEDGTGGDVLAALRLAVREIRRDEQLPHVAL